MGDSGPISATSRNLAENEPLKRSPDFWFDDGSVVLQVETTLFRVHRGVLCSNSSFFQDMFRIPQPADEPSIEGCPVVCIQDATVDWENLLLYMYFPAKFQNLHTVGGSELPLRILCSLLRLGHKYQFDAIKENALGRLKSKIPNSLEEWDAKFEIVYVEEEEYNDVPDAWLFLREFDVINIALELGIKSVLPVAYYLCAITKSPHEMFNGSYCRGNDGALTRLPLAAQQAIIQGQAVLRKAMASSTETTCADDVLPVDSCTNKAQCTEQFRQLSHYLLLNKAFDLRFTLQYQGNLDHISKLCRDCSFHIRFVLAHNRDRYWRFLPVFFGLPEWDELKDFEVS